MLAGSPGTLKQRMQAGKRYWVREHIRADGAKVDEYIGPVASVEAARIEELRGEIGLAQELASASGMLRLLGFQRVDRKPAAVLAVLYNHGMFRAGLTLVGSHAYGALLNELGVVAAGYRTQDIDLARAQPLALAAPSRRPFAALLNETGLRFVPVPGMPASRPSGSFKLPGAEHLMVDLLIPGRQLGKVDDVVELEAHAQAVPLLEFLLDEPLDAVVLSPNQVIPVRIPSPERFALHKLFSSESRRSATGKATKDREQAAVIAAALEEEMPGRLNAAWKAFPRGGRGAVARAAGMTAKLLSGRHPEGQEALRAVAG